MKTTTNPKPAKITIVTKPALCLCGALLTDPREVHSRGCQEKHGKPVEAR